MANAGFGLPLPYTIVSGTGSPTRPWSNITNDEPGLVVTTSPVANSGAVILFVDINSSDSFSFISFLGLNIQTFLTINAYLTNADRTSNTNAIQFINANMYLSANRSGLRRSFNTFTPITRKFLKIQITNTSGGASPISFWRMLIGKWIMPADNIEVSAQTKIDDRGNRRYGVNGRRNFTNVGVWPAFTGQWPWLSKTEYNTMIKPMILKYGASRPVLFVLNYEDTDWGEDDMYYGDLEKDQAVAMDDGQLYSYGFSIVDIAPVVATL